MIPQKKTSCHVFKMGIFPKLFVAVMAHIIMENADEKIKLLNICFQLKIVDILLSFFLWASLYIQFMFMVLFYTKQMNFVFRVQLTHFDPKMNLFGILPNKMLDSVSISKFNWQVILWFVRHIISMILFFVKQINYGFWVQLILIELMILTQK